MKTQVRGIVIILAAVILLAFTAGAVDGDFAWAKVMGGPKFDSATGMVLDNSGNIYATGHFRNAVDFDPGPGVFELDAGDRDDIFVLKLDNIGNLVWAVAMGGSENDVGYDIALDAANNVYATGSFYGTADLDPGPDTFELSSPTSSGAFVLKLDDAGNFLWAGAFLAPGGCRGLGIAVDDEGSVYTTGEFHVYADFDPGPETFTLNASGSSGDPYVSKLDTEGNFVWARAFNGTYSADRALDITLDDAGNVYTTGVFGETMDFDPGPEIFTLNAPTWEYSYLSKLDNDGNFVWAAKFGEGSGRAVSKDGTGNLYTMGSFDETVDFDPGPGVFELTAVEWWEDIFVSKLDREGNFVWAVQMGGEGDVDPMGFTVDDAGNVYITGSFYGTAEFDPGPETASLTSLGWGTDTFILKLDPLGNLVWLKHIGGIYDSHGSCIVADSAGNSFTAGAFIRADLDPGPDVFELPAAGSGDIFITKLYGPPPGVVSIVPAESTTTEGGLLSFVVTFSTGVTGVDVSDFTLTTTGTLAHAQIIHVSGTGNEYMVTVAGAQGDGTLRLDLVDDDSITDGAGTPLGGIGTGNADYFVGGAYTIVPELPLAVLRAVLVLLLALGVYALRRRSRKNYTVW